MSQNNWVTIDLGDDDSATPARPLVYRADANASALVRGVARLIRHQYAHGVRSGDSDVVHDLVQSATEQGQTAIRLSRNDVLHVYLLGWQWLAGGIQAAVHSTERHPPMQEDLRRLFDTELTSDDDKFLGSLLTDGGSVAWMREILIAVRATLR